MCRIPTFVLIVCLFGQIYSDTNPNRLIEHDLFLRDKDDNRVHLEMGRLYYRGWDHASKEFPRGLWKIAPNPNTSDPYPYFLVYQSGSMKKFRVDRTVQENGRMGHLFEFIG